MGNTLSTPTRLGKTIRILMRLRGLVLKAFCCQHLRRPVLVCIQRHRAGPWWALASVQRDPQLTMNSYHLRQPTGYV